MDGTLRLTDSYEIRSTESAECLPVEPAAMAFGLVDS